MPLAPTHFFVPYLLYDFFQQHFSKKKSFFFALLAGLGGAGPDMDFVLAIIYNNLDYHRMVTHNYIFPAVILIAGLILYYLKNKNMALCCTIASFGWASHIFLDELITPLNLTHFEYGYMDAVVLFTWICWESWKKRIELKRFISDLKN